MDFFKDLDTHVPVQVIEVPKISQDIIPQRSVPQMVEQLVEVPTIVSYSSLQRTVEHRVDIPVPGRGWRSSGLPGFLPGQSSTTLQFSKKRISERTVEQIVHFPGEGLQDFRPGQSSPASSSFHSPAGSDDDANEPGDGFFRTFPWWWSSRCPSRSGVRSVFSRSSWRRISMGFSHFSRREKSAKVTRQVGAGVVTDSSSSASRQGHFWEDEDGNMWMSGVPGV